MDFNTEVRKKQLENLEQFISSSTDRVQSVLDYLGWTAEKVLVEETPKVMCPINPNHTMPPKTLNEHINKCIIRNEGYSLNDQFLSEPLHNPQQSIAIDYNKKIEILYRASTENPYFRPAWNGQDPDPRTSNRLTSAYSTDERLELYNYSVTNTTGPEPPSEFTTLYDTKPEENRPLTVEEELARERDAKRRRAKYKSVHLNRKNYTEVIREVISGQMEEYKDWLESKNEIKNTHENNKDCIISNNDELKNEKDEKAIVNTNNNQEKIEDREERPHSSSRNSDYSNSSKHTNNKRYNSNSYRERSRDRRTDYHHKPSNRQYDDKYRHPRSPIRNSYKDRNHRRYSPERRHSSRDRRDKYERSRNRH